MEQIFTNYADCEDVEERLDDKNMDESNPFSDNVTEVDDNICCRNIKNQKFRFSQEHNEFDFSLNENPKWFDEYADVEEQQQYDESCVGHENGSESYEPDVQQSFEVIDEADGSKLWIPNVPIGIKPKVHDLFSSYDEAEVMYRNYADVAGFDVRLNAKKMNKDNVIQTRWFVCSKEGIPKKRNFDSLELGVRDRIYRNSNVKRSGCNACIKIHLLKDKNHYEVYEFNEAHNHVLFNDNDRRFSRRNRKLQYTDFRNVLSSSSYKVGATKAHRIQSALKGGFEYGRRNLVEYQNFKRDVGIAVGNKDAKMLVTKLLKRKEIKSEYFFEHKLNAHELVALFWADEVAQMNYREFGDVVSFDATYRTNEHAMSFVPFLAVDNHKSSVVVGSALIAGETIENYKWVLNAFLKCYEKQPLVVITDQCSAMKQAVPYVFTESRHRLCMWHIMKKVPQKISVALNVNPEFKRVINQLVWNFHISPEEFETRWFRMVEDYDLVGERWFKDMYDIRHSWIPAFYRDNPMSGLMRTTSRSESANAFFNVYLSFHDDLVTFLKRYDSAIEQQRENQAVKEHRTRTTYPQLLSSYAIESHAARLYTRNVFLDFQKQLRKAMFRCGIEGVFSRVDSKTYDVSHKNRFNEVKAMYKVVRVIACNTVDCECGFFIRNGLLCSHILKVFITENVDQIPHRYVLRRWTQDLVSVQLQSARFRYGEADPEKEKLIVALQSATEEAICVIRNEKDLLSKLIATIEDFTKKAKSQLPTEDPAQQKADAINEYFGVAIPDDVDIVPPAGLRNKGSGTGSRLISTSEKIQNISKKGKRKCKKCGKAEGHDSRNCPY